MKTKEVTVYSWVIFFLVAYTTLQILDVALDGYPDITPVHGLVHGSMVLLLFMAVFYFIKKWRRARSVARNADQALQEYLDGLGQKIEESFNRWDLTQAEKRIAIMLIKGKSLKEIAEFCHRSEGTIRQHAVAIYKKSGFAGRAELAAYFLDKIFPDPIKT